MISNDISDVLQDKQAVVASISLYSLTTPVNQPMTIGLTLILLHHSLAISGVSIGFHRYRSLIRIALIT